MNKIKSLKTFLPYILFLLLGFMSFPSTGSDDPYITYWAAYALSEFGEIINYSGEKIEQSSSLLHVLILAILHLITNINIPTISPILTILGGLASIYYTGQLSKFLNINSFVAQLLVSTSIPLLYWSYSGLETSLIGLIILLLIVSFLKVLENSNKFDFILVFLSILAYLLLRPEAFFVVSLFLFLSLMVQYFNKEPIKPVIILMGYSFIVFSLITLFRFIYFDAIFPQPVYAKMGISIFSNITDGFLYFKQGISEYIILAILFLPIISLLFKFKELKQKRIIHIYTLTISYLLFILTSGGDWMGGLRFFAPIIPLLFVLLLQKHSPQKSINKFVIFILVINIYFIGLHITKFSSSYLLPYFPTYKNHLIEKNIEFHDMSFFAIANKVHYRDIPTAYSLDQVLKKVLRVEKNPTIMSGQGGFVSYHTFKKYFGKVKFIDTFALCSNKFTECEVTNKVEKYALGLRLGYNYIFENKKEILDRCNIDIPEIIFDIRNYRMQYVKNTTLYTIVYLQTGDIRYENRILGRKVIGHQWIAVRNDIYQKLKLNKVEYEF